LHSPLVSILCITFKHEKYIARTLEGFLSQETDFTFEIIIHDDASPDKTQDIIREYVAKAAGNKNVIFRPILEKKNRFTRDGDVFVTEMFKSARGKYIAFCEGDDYWSDPTKLQRQVDYMETHPEAALCFHPVRVFFENHEEPDSVFPEPEHAPKYTRTELLRRNYIQTNSVLYRKQNYDGLRASIMPQDWYLHLYHAQYGTIGFINRVMAAYRRHLGSAWWDTYKDYDKIWLRHGVLYTGIYEAMLQMYGNNAKYKKIILESLYYLFGVFIGVDEKHNGTLFEQVLAKYPALGRSYVLYLRNQATELQHTVTQQDKEVYILKQENTQKGHDLKEAITALETIHASRMWKTRNIVAKAIGKNEL
jgi:glycosyltransferase involved in cell wall biosynthesis